MKNKCGGDTSCTGLKKLRALAARRSSMELSQSSELQKPPPPPHPSLRAVTPVTVEGWDPGIQA